MQIATISKSIIRFWVKFHIQILGYSFTRNSRFLLTPSRSFQGKQENPYSSASRHVSNSLRKYFFLDSELSNERMKVQVKRAFKSYFLTAENNKKADRLCIKFSSTCNTSVLRYLYPLFQNRHPHFLLPHLFWKMSQPPGQVLLITTIVVDLSRIFLGFFLKPLYPTMVAKKFQIHGVNKFVSQIESVYSRLQPKLFPRKLSPPLQGKKITHSSQTKCFKNLLFPSREGRDYGAENMTKIKLARVLITSSDKFHSTNCNL